MWADDGPRLRDAPSSGFRVMSSHQTWMAVERLENWEADQATGFTMFGIPERVRKRVESIREVDLIVAYVSSAINSLANIRRITTPTIEKLGFVRGYDDIFPFCIRTESVLVLEREAWVPFRGMLDDLSIPRVGGIGARRCATPSAC